MLGEKNQENKLALSNSTSRADGSNTPESLLEGCIDNHTVTQASVVECSAKGQVLGRNKMVTRNGVINSDFFYYSIYYYA